MPRLLIVEATQAVRGSIAGRLGGDIAVQSAANIQAALAEHNENSYDLVVWDTVSAPSENSNTIQIIKKFLKTQPESRAIILSNVQKPDINAPIFDCSGFKSRWTTITF